MSEVTVLPAASARIDDALVAICGGGGGACCCQYWRMSSSAYAQSSVDERKKAWRAAAAADPAPGVVAYVDGEPAAWCGLARAAASSGSSGPGRSCPWTTSRLWIVRDTSDTGMTYLAHQTRAAKGC